MFVLSQPTNLEPDPSGEGTSAGPILPSASLEVTGDNDEDDNDDDEDVTVVSLLSPHAPTSSSVNPLQMETAPTEPQQIFQSSLRGSSNPFIRLFHRRQHRHRRPHGLGKKTRWKSRSLKSALFPSVGGTSSISTGSSASAIRPFDLRMRLSTGDEYSLPVTSNQSVLEAKKHLAVMIGWPPDRQRWYCGGVALRDGLRIADCPSSIAPPMSFVVQVVVHSPLEPESTWGQQNRSRE